MKYLLVRLFTIAFLFVLLALWSQHSMPLIEADSNIIMEDGATTNAPYARVGPGRYEAECSTLSGAWTLRKAKRASKGSEGCTATNNATYIDASSTASKVCLKFKNATRVGIGYVAGNYKGKATVSLKDENGAPFGTPRTLNLYDSYPYNESQPAANLMMTALAADDDPTSGADEGDIDNTAPDAYLSFWAFRWQFTNDTSDNLPTPPSKGEICVSPKTAGDVVSIDYFVVGSGDKIALRGFARKQDYISQSATRSLWNYNACPEVWTVPAGCYNNSNVAEMLPASGSDAWEGFVPKIFDPSNWGNNDNSTRNNFKTTYVYAVIQGARTYAGGADTFVPKYWILFNEPDAAGFFAENNFPQLEPEHPGYLHGSVNLVWAIRQGYIDKGITPPKIIIETGSQIHAPGTSATNHWSGDGCNPGAFPPDKDPNDYWGCTHDNSVWISDFWNALKADMNANSTSYPMSLAEVKAAIGGFGGHYYPPADANCGLPSCYLNTTRPVEFVSALKTWMSSEFSDREVWMIETATHLTSSTGCTNVTYGQLGILEQRDTFPCDQSDESTKYYNVRNYVGKLQEAFAEAGVNRWAWFADRYGGKNPCSDGSGGEMTALNASCTSYVESPFGNNYSLAASYR